MYSWCVVIRLVFLPLFIPLCPSLFSRFHSTMSSNNHGNAGSFVNYSTPFVGLPGKQIKLRKPIAASCDSQQSSRNHEHAYRRGSRARRPSISNFVSRGPLGISVDTNVSTRHKQPPNNIGRVRGDSPYAQARSQPPSAPKEFNKSAKNLKRRLAPPSLDLERDLSPFDRDIPIALGVPQTACTQKHSPKHSHGQPPKVHEPKHTRKPELSIATGRACSYAASIFIVSPLHSAGNLSSLRARFKSPARETPPNQTGSRLAYEDTPASTSSKSVTPYCKLSGLKTAPTCPASDWPDSPDDELLSALSAPDPMISSSPQNHRLSPDTVLPTPRRSKGWWNLITSPFLSYGRTSDPYRPKQQPLVDAAAPEVPIVARAAPMSTSSEPALTPKGPTPFDNYSPPHYGTAAEYYDLNNNFESPQERAFEGTPQDRASQAINSPATDGSSSGHSRIEAQRTQHAEPDANHPQSQEVLERQNVSKFHEQITPQPPQTKVALAPSTPPASSTVHHTESHYPEIKTLESSRTKTTSSNGFSPVVEVASVRHFRLTRGVHTKKEEDALLYNLARSSLEQSEKTDEKAKPRPGQLLRPERQIADMVKTRPKHDDNPSPSLFTEGGTLQSKSSRNERLFLIGFTAISTAVVLLCVILALTVTQRPSDMPVQAQWLNLTDFPPLPTGISTVANAKSTTEPRCVDRVNLWQCSVPKEQRSSLLGVNSAQPNFRIEIRSHKTGPSSPLTSHQSNTRRSSPNMHHKNYIADRAIQQTTKLMRRSGFSSLIDAPNPGPPTSNDRAFLGKTTDKTSQPYQGEDTPFTISILPLTDLQGRKHRKREQPLPDMMTGNGSSDTLPKPSTDLNGTASAAQLYPLAYAQPLALFDRGRDSEHYGFYTYFDRSIFLQLTKSNGSSGNLNTGNSSNVDGGARIEDSNARCTWSQTRFHVQMWTRATQVSTIPAPQGLNGSTNASSASDFSQRGSFPLPITVTIDRHGGDGAKKGLYCFGLGALGRPDDAQNATVAESRSYGGTLVNPASSPFAQQVEGNGSGGGVDGGTGGCYCQYRNF